MWPFRSKLFKALDKLYDTYDSLYDSYRGSTKSTNELHNLQAKVIRGQLFQIGAAFDMLVDDDQPIIKEFGYIPFTSAKFRHEKDSWAVLDTRLEYLGITKKKHNKIQWKTSKVARLLTEKYNRDITIELRNHKEVIDEAVELNLILESNAINSIELLSEVYYLPKEKRVVD